jgi:hypothetical protein
MLSSSPDSKPVFKTPRLGSSSSPIQVSSRMSGFVNDPTRGVTDDDNVISQPQLKRKRVLSPEDSGEVSAFIRRSLDGSDLISRIFRSSIPIRPLTIEC